MRNPKFLDVIGSFPLKNGDLVDLGYGYTQPKQLTTIHDCMDKSHDPQQFIS